MALLAVVALGATTREPPPRRVTWAGADTGGPGLAVMTLDPGDRYDVRLDGTVLTARAAQENRGINTRMFVWPRDTPPSRDSESCAAWVAKSGPNVQLGAALRVTREGGRVRGITLTQNVVAVQWTFNVHTWDTARDEPYELIDQHDLSSTFLAGGLPPPPWHLCVRVIGPRLQFKVWSGDEDEPRWGDEFHGGSTDLPDGWDRFGQSGWYVGHLQAGEGAGLSDLSTWSYDALPPDATAPGRLPVVSPAAAHPPLW